MPAEDRINYVWPDKLTRELHDWETDYKQGIKQISKYTVANRHPDFSMSENRITNIERQRLEKIL